MYEHWEGLIIQINDDSLYTCIDLQEHVMTT